MLDVFELRIIATVGGEYCENVLHLQGDNTASISPESDALQLITDWMTSVQSAWMQCLPTDYLLRGYKAKRVNNTGGPSAVTIVSPNVAGTRPNPSASTQQSALLTGDYYCTGCTPPRWRTTRIFLPGIAKGDVTGNVLLPALVVNMGLLASSLYTPFGTGPAGPWTYGAWSARSGPGPTYTPSFYIADPLEASILVGTQRRRLHPVI
jgi:hypothetical protein